MDFNDKERIFCSLGAYFSVKTLNCRRHFHFLHVWQGTLPLDSLWREVVESVEKSATKLSVSVARCYPMKNRASDVLPFDQSRVELKEKKVLNLFL